MFGLFKKRVHEPLEKQCDDIVRTMTDEISKIAGDKALNGLDCDVLPGGTGPFGSADNPIPVNGAIGEVKYLAKLRSPTGKALLFHRTGNKGSAATANLVDCYEVVSMDGTGWDKLHFDCYHPRRSNFAPDGYTLTPYNKSLGMDIPAGFGCSHRVANFPESLPEAVTKFYGESMGGAFARRIEARLREFDFSRPVEAEVHSSCGRLTELTIPEAQLNEWIDSGSMAKVENAIEVRMLDPNGCYVTNWQAGKEISKELVNKYLDAGTNVLYAVTIYREGEPEVKVADRSTWLKIQEAMGGWSERS